MPRPHSSYGLADNALVLSGVAVLSPIAGLALEMVLAVHFGATAVVDSYRIASILLVFGNQILVGQLLPQIVVPIFQEYLGTNRTEDAWRFVGSLLMIFGALTGVFAAWAWTAPDPIVSFLGPGLSASARADALLFVRYFSLSLVLTAFSGVMAGALYCQGMFWPSAVGQLLGNGAAIVAIATMRESWGGASLLVGALVGAASGFVLHLHFFGRIAKQAGVRLVDMVGFGPSRGLSKALRLAGPLLTMILIAQWSIILINRVLSDMPPGSLASFGYAWKLLAIVGILPASLATVIFPALSAANNRDDASGFSTLVMRSIRMTLLLIIPVAAFLYVLREPIVRISLGRGAMTPDAVSETAEIFGVLLFGVAASGLVGIVQKALLSVQDSRAPAVAAVVSALLLTLFLPGAAAGNGTIGVAWFYNGVTWAVAISLLAYYGSRYRTVDFRNLFLFCGLLGLVCVGVTVPAIALGFWLQAQPPPAVSVTGLAVGVIAATSAAVGCGLLKLFRIRESAEIYAYIRWRTANFNLLP